MVKRYLRFSIESIILQTICLFMAACGICVIVGYFMGNYADANTMYGIFGFIASVLAVVFLLYEELAIVIGCIHLNEDCISVREEIISSKFNKKKIQYPTSIKYKDIDSIEIVASMENSKGQKIPLSRPGAMLILTNEKGKKFRFGLFNMSKKTVNRMLKDLLKKCEEVNGITFDVDKLTKDFQKARFAA